VIDTSRHILFGTRDNSWYPVLPRYPWHRVERGSTAVSNNRSLSPDWTETGRRPGNEYGRDGAASTMPLVWSAARLAVWTARRHVNPIPHQRARLRDAATARHRMEWA